MNDVMLTTVDNPYNPFTQFEDWYKFDMINGYDTCGLIARYSGYSTKTSDENNDKDLNDSLKRIIDIYPMIYKIVKPDDY